jgi:hypothetical protein
MMVTAWASTIEAQAVIVAQRSKRISNIPSAESFFAFSQI